MGETPPNKTNVTASPEVQRYQTPQEKRYLVTAPVAHYFSLLVGGALVTLGILGFIPPLTPHNALFGIFQVSAAYNVIHLVTGIAGLVAFALPQEHLDRPYALFLAAVYLATFSVGNILIGDAANSTTIQRSDIPYILANAFHAGLMLAGALVFGLTALQRGDRATETYRYRFYREVERYNGPNNGVPTP